MDAAVEIGPVGGPGPGPRLEIRQEPPPGIHEIILPHPEFGQGGHIPGNLLHRGIHVVLIRVDDNRIFYISGRLGAAEIIHLNGRIRDPLCLQPLTEPPLDDQFEFFGKDIHNERLGRVHISPRGARGKIGHGNRCLVRPFQFGEGKRRGNIRLPDILLLHGLPALIRDQHRE